MLVPSIPTKVDKNLYITKLRLDKVQPYDSGYYFCVAVVSTAQDFVVKCKTVYLNVISPDPFSGKLLKKYNAAVLTFY